MQALTELRKSIDNIDNAIIAMLAERFKITHQVGEYKALHGLPAKDETRELSQHQRVQQLAQQYGLDQAFARQLLDSVITQVIANHERIATDRQA